MRIFKRIIDSFRELFSYQFTIYAGNAAYFTILSIFPAAVLLLSIIQLTPLTVENLEQFFDSVIPGSLQLILSDILSAVPSLPSTTIISISAVTAAWSASRGVLGIVNGVNAIYNVRDQRSYLRKRLLSLFYMVLLIAGIVLTLTLHTFGQKLLAFIGRYLPGLYSVVSLLLQLKFIVVIAFLSLLFTAMFYFFPSCKTTLRCSIPGAVTAAVGWVGFSELFSIYVNYNRLSTLYGSVTMIILMMLWIYFSMTILMFGAVVNQELRSGHTHRLLFGLQQSRRRRKKKSKSNNSSSNVTNSTNTVDF